MESVQQWSEALLHEKIRKSVTGCTAVTVLVLYLDTGTVSSIVDIWITLPADGKARFKG